MDKTAQQDTGAATGPLAELIAIAEATFGHFDAHPPYRQLYPWVVSCLAGLCPGAAVLDAGAGVTPLPLFLARRGIAVDTVDAAPEQVHLPLHPDATAWGFLDYGRLSPGLRSFNTGIEDFQPDRAYDAVYSVGTLAHLAMQNRRVAFSRFRGMIVPGGILAIHVDLVRGTDSVWRHCRGREIEPASVHGDAGAVLDELAQAGFAVQGSRILRAAETGVRTDSLTIAAIAA